MPSEPYHVNPGDKITASWANSVVSSVNKRKFGSRRKLQFAGGDNGTCPFGEFVVDTSSKPAVRKILGGLVFAGDKNYLVPDYDIQINNDREVYVYLRYTVKVNMDDDNDILLPGIDTGTDAPSFLETTGGYPDNTSPTVPDGFGTFRIPIAYLKIENKQLKDFNFAICGNILSDHCAGTLSFTT